MIGPPIRPEGVEVLLFDLGGVVIDIDFGRCMTSWANAAGPGAEDIAGRFAFDAAYEDHERGTLAIHGYLDSLRRTLSLDLTDEQLLAGWNDIYIGPDREVGRMLEQAKDHLPLYAFTNSNPTHQAVWSQRFATELAVFAEIFVSSEIGHRKPERAGFELVASLIGVAPAEILFFDDSLENVEGAADAGMQAVHVTSAASVRDALARVGVTASIQHGDQQMK